MLVPKSLNDAFGLAKIQEEYLISNRKTFKPISDISKPSILGLPKLEGRNDSKVKLPLQKQTNAQMEERRKQGFCYNCDEKWVPCKVYILLTGPTATLFRKKNIKNMSHGTIHTFKNYCYSVFSFQQNKLYPNGPLLDKTTQ